VIRKLAEIAPPFQPVSGLFPLELAKRCQEHQAVHQKGTLRILASIAGFREQKRSKYVCNRGSTTEEGVSACLLQCRLIYQRLPDPVDAPQGQPAALFFEPRADQPHQRIARNL
jgi:hypothetical protein